MNYVEKYLQVLTLLNSSGKKQIFLQPVSSSWWYASKMIKLQQAHTSSDIVIEQKKPKKQKTAPTTATQGIWTLSPWELHADWSKLIVHHLLNQ